MQEVNKKVLLLGRLGVGKTSLVNRFVHNRFSDTCFSTIGVRIEKKQVVLTDVNMNLVIWDIAGESSQRNTPQSYFLGAHGIIYLFDITSAVTYENIEEEIAFVKQKLAGVPFVIVANKTDLLGPGELELLVKNMKVKPDMTCSAKNNNNVEPVFVELCKLMLINS
jgi:small GTP-binding protein